MAHLIIRHQPDRRRQGTDDQAGHAQNKVFRHGKRKLVLYSEQTMRLAETDT